MNYTIHTGDNVETLKTLADNSVDSIVTDPPYGIAFLGKDWDNNTGAIETWEECFRVLKPGGHILAFSAARTYHHLATNIETVGFEIRDQLMWLYGSGFPKAQDMGKAIDKRNGKIHKKPDLIPYDNKGADSEGLGAFRGKCPKCKKDQTHQLKCDDQLCVLKDTVADNEWAGWKTALKPAHEPIVMARKPFKGSCVDNVLEHGTGALNIDASRVGDESPVHKKATNTYQKSQKMNDEGNYEANAEWQVIDNPNVGRFPSNVIGEVPEHQKYFANPQDKADHEPIVMARKPFKGSCVDNVLEHGTGALNIDESRIPFQDEADYKSAEFGRDKNKTFGYIDTEQQGTYTKQDMEVVQANPEGRFPSNVLGEVPEHQKYFANPQDSKADHEAIVMARKPFKGSCVDNVLEHGTGALNIDESRVPWGEDDDPEAYVAWMKKYPNSTGSKAVFNNAHADAKGVDYVKDQDADVNKDRDIDGRLRGRFPSNVLGEVEDYQKYFYCPKVSRKERHVGFENKPKPYDRREEGLESAGIQGLQKLNGEKHAQGSLDQREKIPGEHPGNRVLGANDKVKGNNHPTVKPVELMKYLVKLVTPAGGKVLDPFNGSGSTGMAAVELGYEYIGCELDPEYVEIAKQRIEGWYKQTQPKNNFNNMFEEDDASK